MGGKGSGRKHIPWEARICYKKSLNELELLCPEILPRTVIGKEEHDLFEKLGKLPHQFYYDVKTIVIRRHSDGTKKG